MSDLKQLRIEQELDGEELATLIRIREEVKRAIFAKRQMIRCRADMIKRGFRSALTKPREPTPGKPAGREGHAIPADHRGVA